MGFSFGKSKNRQSKNSALTKVIYNLRNKRNQAGEAYSTPKIQVHPQRGSGWSLKTYTFYESDQWTAEPADTRSGLERVPI